MDHDYPKLGHHFKPIFNYISTQIKNIKLNLHSLRKTVCQYKLKPQFGVSIPLISAFLVLAIFGFIKFPESSFKWWMLGVVVILLISFLRAFFIIDMNKKEVRAGKGLFGSTITFPVDKLQGFTIHKLKQYGIITINVSLHAQYINEKGKSKEVALVQSFLQDLFKVS